MGIGRAGTATRNCQGKWQLAQPSVCPVETEKTEKIRRVCWLSVLDCGNWQHQSPAPAAPRATMRQGEEETSGMAVPVRRCCLCSHTRAHLENGPPGRWALSSRAGRQPEELEPFSARREAQVGHWKGCQLLDGNAIS